MFRFLKIWPVLFMIYFATPSLKFEYASSQDHCPVRMPDGATAELIAECKSKTDRISQGLLGDPGVIDKTENEKSEDLLPGKDLILFTVASNETDGFRRFMRTARLNNISVKVLGLGQDWKGGDVRNKPGGGYKINLFRKALEPYKNDANKVVIFSDSYDVLLLGSSKEILQTFAKFNARLVFGAEGFCWPDESLAASYPTTTKGKRFLNSGGFIGYAQEVYELVNWKSVSDLDDDQLFYTRAYLNTDLRNKLNWKLDHLSEIFQNLNGATSDVEMRFKDGTYIYLENTVYGTRPLLLHGNGPSKLALNSLSNYLVGAWNSEQGCLSCWEDVGPSLQNVKDIDYPRVFVALFVEQPTPFLEEFFEKIEKLTYPKSKIDLFLNNMVEYHDKLVESWTENIKKQYNSIHVNLSQKNTKTNSAISRDKALNMSLEAQADFFFSIDSDAHLDNPHTLRLLIEQNRGVLAPMLVRPYKAWSNFWGALTSDGFYARSSDYMDIIHSEKKGVWNVPYVSSCYLINSTILKNPDTRPSYVVEDLDSDMAFALTLREKMIFIYVSNRLDFGHLVNPETFDTTLTNPELYQLLDNRWDWEQRYLHSNYSENFNPEFKVPMPCPDVYWFPVTSPRFCKEFIEIMEAFGRWSDGTNNDTRLEGGYENVPTRDIHMKQVGLEPVWSRVLKDYIRPLQELVFIGYFHDPPRSLMNFVVRYRPDEQPSLRPHHDSSTYTINLALNRPGIDYQGGGCHFLRYNCSVKETRIGWLLMHPGRLTHYHEGLPVTSGTRYIMISFVDP